ncbi:hypothetical protein [Pseudomonas sp. EMN2]|uniref:hypothetical protein n=1 Tax=Pseudomonas sp. EMN2 TaxID=2615212 RepID=UPI00129A7CAF|nr:hypothetical protein [Pseudomonas sp. EMN2]
MKHGKPQKDVLDLMTKDELVAWVRENCLFRQPKMSELLYQRWQKQSEEVIEARRTERHALDGIDLKERDRLATLFNQTESAVERLRILEQMEPYEKALKEHMKRYQALDRKQARIDALYEQIDVERQKEMRS